MSGADAIAAWFADQPDLDVEEAGGADGRAWFVMLRGERKRTIPVYLQLGERHLLIQSFFMRRPDENEGAVYADLLRRNLSTYVCRFAQNADGDILLVGILPRDAITPEELDRVMGQVLSAADEAFNPALRAGFSSYIEREQAWRAKVGAARNPIT